MMTVTDATSSLDERRVYLKPRCLTQPRQVQSATHAEGREPRQVKSATHTEAVKRSREILQNVQRDIALKAPGGTSYDSGIDECTNWPGTCHAIFFFPCVLSPSSKLTGRRNWRAIYHYAPLRRIPPAWPQQKAEEVPVAPSGARLSLGMAPRESNKFPAQNPQ